MGNAIALAHTATRHLEVAASTQGHDLLYTYMYDERGDAIAATNSRDLLVLESLSVLGSFTEDILGNLAACQCPVYVADMHMLLVGPLAQFLHRTLASASAEQVTLPVQSQNKHPGRPPYGYKMSSRKGYLEKDPETHRHMLAIRAMKQQGQTDTYISTYLNKNKVTTKRGKRWTATAVSIL